MIQQGFRFVTVGSDVRLLVAKAAEVLQAMGRPSSVAKAPSIQTGPY